MSNVVCFNEDTPVVFNSLNEKTRTVSARELHERLGITERFNSWFGRMCQYGFSEESKDFCGCKVFNTLANQYLDDYDVSIDMAKEICMIQRNEAGKMFRRYFIEVEKRWSQMVKSPMERILANSTNQLETARAITQMLEIEHQKQLRLEAQKQVTIDFYENNLKEIHKGVTALKTERDEAVEDYKGLYDGFISNEGWFAMEDVANRLAIKGMGRNKLFKFLRDKGILMSDNTPYRNYIDEGYFMVNSRVIQMGNFEKIIHKTLVSKAGMAFIEKKIRKAGR